MSNRQCASVGMGLFLVAILLSIAYLPQFATIIFVSLILHSLLVDTVDSMSAGQGYDRQGFVAAGTGSEGRKQRSCSRDPGSGSCTGSQSSAVTGR